MRGNVLVRARRRLFRVILPEVAAFVSQPTLRSVILDFYPIDAHFFFAPKRGDAGKVTPVFWSDPSVIKVGEVVPIGYGVIRPGDADLPRETA